MWALEGLLGDYASPLVQQRASAITALRLAMDLLASPTGRPSGMAMAAWRRCEAALAPFSTFSLDSSKLYAMAAVGLAQAALAAGGALAPREGERIVALLEALLMPTPIANSKRTVTFAALLPGNSKRHILFLQIKILARLAQHWQVCRLVEGIPQGSLCPHADWDVLLCGVQAFFSMKMYRSAARLFRSDRKGGAAPQEEEACYKGAAEEVEEGEREAREEESDQMATYRFIAARMARQGGGKRPLTTSDEGLNRLAAMLFPPTDAPAGERACNGVAKEPFDDAMIASLGGVEGAEALLAQLMDRPTIERALQEVRRWGDPFLADFFSDRTTWLIIRLLVAILDGLPDGTADARPARHLAPETWPFVAHAMRLGHLCGHRIDSATQTLVRL